MSYPLHTKAIVCYIEAHIKDSKINYKELETRIGFSLAHIRDFFEQNTGYPLAKYVRMRKIKCSAQELINSDRTILEISYKYGFSNPETYTRAFQSIMGMTPSGFRRQKYLVGKEELIPGVYGIGILNEKEYSNTISYQGTIYKNNESTLLFGVSKINEYPYGGNTRYPICLKACAEYLGDNLSYPFVMAASAAAFRFVWNAKMWDLSNIDIFHTFDESNDIYKLGAQALGREFSFLERTKNTTKEEFMRFIKDHIDKGYPCIALGIIGPPEPCLITGYRHHGEVLLGINFFQNDPEFAGDLEIDESGYFVSKTWWENPDTAAVMCIGPIVNEVSPIKSIIASAIKALDGRIEGDYCKGITAYKAWKKALSNEKDFVLNQNYSCLLEKLFCQLDAMRALIDGRKCAAAFFSEQAKKQPSYQQTYEKISAYFTECTHAIEDMQSLYGNTFDMDEQLKVFLVPKTRKQCCRFIDRAFEADSKALALMKKLLSS